MYSATHPQSFIHVNQQRLEWTPVRWMKPSCLSPLWGLAHSTKCSLLLLLTFTLEKKILDLRQQLTIDQPSSTMLVSLERKQENEDHSSLLNLRELSKIPLNCFFPSSPAYWNIWIIEYGSTVSLSPKPWQMHGWQLIWRLHTPCSPFVPSLLFVPLSRRYSIRFHGVKMLITFIPIQMISNILSDLRPLQLSGMCQAAQPITGHECVCEVVVGLPMCPMQYLCGSVVPSVLSAQGHYCIGLSE